MTEQRSTGSGATRHGAYEHEAATDSSHSQLPGATRASKRSRTTAAAAAAASPKAHTTLNRPGNDDDHNEGAGDGDGDVDPEGGDLAHLPPLSKHATEKEKEARRMARMIRNRNAAQASRDRKKEHTAFLERRVAQLESLLTQAGRPAPAAPTTFSFSAPVPDASAAPSRLRATSVSSSTSSSADAGRFADLEDENESLRAQLQVEQSEKAQLLVRLELVEEKLARLTTPDAGPISFSPFSGTSTPLPAYEPTFAFNTPDIKPLPQPEERAFVEERERQRRRASQISFDAAVTLGPPFSLDRAGSTTTVSVTTEGLAESQSRDRTGSSRLVAAEATGSCSSIAALSATAPSTPSLSSGASSVSEGSVAGGLELDISSTPPTSESYLDLHDLDVSPGWSAWAKPGALPLDSKAGPFGQAHENADDESALAFLDLSAFHDAPMTAATRSDDCA